MLNKIVGYSGFRTYGELEYPTRKQGKELEQTNQVWADTRHSFDHQKPLANYHNQATIYNDSYQPLSIEASASRLNNIPPGSTVPAYDKKQAAKQLKNTGEPQNKLVSGVEHWRSNYQTTMIGRGYSVGRSVNNINSFGNTAASNWRGVSMDRKGTTINDWGKPKGDADTNLQQSGQFSQTAGGFNRNGGRNDPNSRLNQERSSQAYINNCPTGMTDYKFQYGEKIGSKPLDLLNTMSRHQPLRNDPLKFGTNQLWTEIPGYSGFRPAELPFDILKNKIEQRKNEQKGGPKLNIVENYHVHTPGYAGFKSVYTSSAQPLRESCLGGK